MLFELVDCFRGLVVFVFDYSVYYLQRQARYGPYFELLDVGVLASSCFGWFVCFCHFRGLPFVVVLFAFVISGVFLCFCPLIRGLPFVAVLMLL